MRFGKALAVTWAQVMISLFWKPFRSAEDAAAKLPDIEPDIVIMDINLPGMNGIECIRAVKRKCKTIQFIMFTVYETDDKIF
jgi:DNA-binding NarL/FixJ family response regulator